MRTSGISRAMFDLSPKADVSRLSYHPGRRVPLCHGVELCHLLVTQRAVLLETLIEN
jgi:hypothetical protein